MVINVPMSQILVNLENFRFGAQLAQKIRKTKVLKKVNIEIPISIQQCTHVPNFSQFEEFQILGPHLPKKYETQKFWWVQIRTQNTFAQLGRLVTVFLTQIISRQQKKTNAKVVLLISRQQKWNSCQQFSKNCIFSNIQINSVVNRLTPFKNLSNHTNRFLMITGKFSIT